MSAPIALHSKNYLLVSIDLPSGKVAAFARQMKKLMPTFTDPVKVTGNGLTFGWTLVAAFRSAQGRKTRVTHLWQVDPVKPPMTDVMGECGTNPDYAALDVLVDREVQNYMFTNDAYNADGSTWPRRLPKACAIETLQVTRWPKKLGVFEQGKSLLSETGMTALAERALQAHGWTLLLPITPETGLLRQFVHFWAIDKSGTQSVARFRQWLSRQPEYTTAVESTAIMAAEPIAYGRRVGRR